MLLLHPFSHPVGPADYLYTICCSLRYTYIKSDSPYTLEADPENLKKCIQRKDPFSFVFANRLNDFCYSSLGGNCPYDIYFPIEYAIKLNDLESLKCLLDLPNSSRYFSIRDVFFYMECLNWTYAPNLEVLGLLLDRIQDINAKATDPTGETRNLMDYAIYRMAEIRKIHVGVIEELSSRGAEGSDISRPILFELLESRGHASILKAFTGQPKLAERVIECIKACPTYLDFEENPGLRFDFRWSVVQCHPVSDTSIQFDPMSDSEWDSLVDSCGLHSRLGEQVKRCVRELVNQAEESSFNPRLEGAHRDVCPNFEPIWV